jgi:hypothetical protein
MTKEFVFPSDSTAKKELMAEIERGCNVLNEIKVLEGDIDTLAEEVKEKFGMATGEYKKYVKANYDKIKFMQAKEKLDKIAEDLKLV